MMDKELRYLGWFLLAHLGNFVDACLTLHVVSRGAVELNPLMSVLIDYSPFSFLAVKFIIFEVGCKHVSTDCSVAFKFYLNRIRAISHHRFLEP